MKKKRYDAGNYIRTEEQIRKSTETLHKHLADGTVVLKKKEIVRPKKEKRSLLTFDVNLLTEDIRILIYELFMSGMSVASVTRELAKQSIIVPQCAVYWSLGGVKHTTKIIPQFDIPIKQCKLCKVEFKPQKPRQTYCEECGSHGWSHRILKYGIGKREFDAMYVFQCGKCAICEKEIAYSNKDTHIDHDHITGNVRGLLCNMCNVKMGILDDLNFMERANKYIMSDNCWNEISQRNKKNVTK